MCDLCHKDQFTPEGTLLFIHGFGRKSYKTGLEDYYVNGK